MKQSFQERLYAIAQLQLKVIEEMDLQPEDWSKVEVDTLILVRNEVTSSWDKRYFKRYNRVHDSVDVFTNGRTSKTVSSDNDYGTYRYMKLMEE